MEETLGQMLAAQAVAQPGRVAMTFRTPGEGTEQRTYGQLAERAGLIAAALGLGVRRAPLVLALPTGFDLTDALFAAWFAGAIAVPAMPPRPGRRSDRFDSILATTGATIVITNRACEASIREACSRHSPAPAVLLIEDLAGYTGTPIDPQADGSTLALVQFTSGSIGNPKGVMLTHANLLANQRQIAANFGHGPDTVVAGWLPMHHDMGLIGSAMQPLFVGGEVHLIPPEAFLMRPLRWLELIHSTKATTSGGPNFGYDLCVSRVTAEQAAQLDLSAWRVAFNGAEPVRAHTIARFMRHFAPAKFRPTTMHPCFGLAEATLIVAGKAPGANVRLLKRPGEQLPRVSCGAAVEDSELAIVDPDALTERGADEVGEVWVRGPSVARGYWGLPDDTTFGNALAGRGEGWMRSGDLGALVNGELIITGRLKDVIIIGGQNHAAEDLEHAVQQALGRGTDTACAAFAIESEEGEGLVIAVELPRDESIEPARLTAIVGKALTEAFDVQPSTVLSVSRGRLPRTTSGKIRRRETRALYLESKPPFNQP